MKQKDFEWPDVANEIERIKRNSELYKNLDIREAFQKAYGIKIKKSRKKDANLMYHDVQPGEIIPLKITHIDKKTVTCECSQSLPIQAFQEEHTKGDNQLQSHF